MNEYYILKEKLGFIKMTVDERYEINQLLDKIEKQLLIHVVSQRSEPLGCEHVCIRIKGRDEGVCADCGVEMTRTWQPNCG